MFREYIQNPIDPIPQEYIDTISRLENEPDYSLTCLGIALLKERINPYKGISGVYCSYPEESSAVLNLFDREESLTDVPMFCYYTYTHNYDNVKSDLALHDYVIIEKIGAFLKEKADVDCIAARHKEKNIAAIFIRSKDIKYYHLLISFLSLMMPNLFKYKPLEQKDYSIITTLAKNDKLAFVQSIKNAVAPYTMDFRRMMLGTLLKAMHEGKVNHAFRDVSDQRRYVESTKTEYTNAIKHLKELIVLYEGLKATENVNDLEDEFVEYLSTNKQLFNLKIQGSKLTFAVGTLLNNYNEDAWESFAKAGHIFDGKYMQNNLLDAFKDRENRKILLNSIFCESPEFAIKICSNYTLDFDSCNCTSTRTYDYVVADPELKEYIPNPHFKNYSCFGQFGDRIIDAMLNRNYIVAVEYCCASAGSVNLEETEQNFRPFLGWLLTSREKVLRRKDGVDMTPEEALIYLVDKEKEE